MWLYEIVNCANKNNLIILIFQQRVVSSYTFSVQAWTTCPGTLHLLIVFLPRRVPNTATDKANGLGPRVLSGLHQQNLIYQRMMPRLIEITFSFGVAGVLFLKAFTLAMLSITNSRPAATAGKLINLDYTDDAFNGPFLYPSGHTGRTDSIFDRKTESNLSGVTNQTRLFLTDNVWVGIRVQVWGRGRDITYYYIKSLFTPKRTGSGRVIPCVLWSCPVHHEL